MNATQTLIFAVEGGAIGDGRTGANLALAVGALAVVLGRLATARVAGRVTFGTVRTGAWCALVVGLAGVFLAVLHLATSDGGPGTGNGMVGAVVAVPLGLLGMYFGARVLGRGAREAR